MEFSITKWLQFDYKKCYRWAVLHKPVYEVPPLKSRLAISQACFKLSEQSADFAVFININALCRR